MSEHLSAPTGVGVIGLDGVPSERTVAARVKDGSVVGVTANPNLYRTSSDVGGRA
ncbi:hypothetical protein [Parasphingorhabdus pacifica]